MLVVAVARRDGAALAELYRRHAGSLFCAALRVLSMRPLAEEVVQDVFLRLWQNPERFQPERGSLRAFLLAQCHGHAIDIVRSEGARRRREERNIHAVKSAYLLEDQILDFVAGEELRRAVATLCATEREAISLAYFGGRTYLEVAALLGVPEGTIKSRIRSGLARLRVALVDAGMVSSSPTRWSPGATGVRPSALQHDGTAAIHQGGYARAAAKPSAGSRHPKKTEV